ncbi:thiamine diphosphokinase [Lachnobacterium bovis]|uniref:thiamine diphosphokinase n=1 Tax=Lachnobacterium bovis TaxID=140626 RepID=UPI0003B42714|nr:thiamine diphosphokinase [Lachnobacterium bovis]
MKFAIVTGGKINDKYVSGILKNEKFDQIIAVDSGLDFFKRTNIKPNVIIGDFDSVDKDSKKYFDSKENIKWITLNPVKDDTDTEHAIHYAIDSGASYISLFGATGGRIDHLLANISLLGIGLEKNIPIIMQDSKNKVFMLKDAKNFKIKNTKACNEDKKHFISLIPYTAEVKNVTLSGFKYPLHNYNMGGFNALGISNEIIGDFGIISFDKGILIVVEAID